MPAATNGRRGRGAYVGGGAGREAAETVAVSPPEVPALDINPIDARQHLRLLAGELDAISNPSLTVEQRLRRRDLAHRILAQLHQHLYPGEK